ncbi:MAG: autotransporter outer membrane beta-barrel domain-containing protein, partial [Caulobacteraceae bacterium]
NTQPAIVIDSNNVVVNSGAVGANNNVANGSGVLVNGGFTGSYSGAGTITLSEDYTATDTANSDGVVEAPFAQGGGRFGLRLVGAAPFIGDISPAGAITVKGVDSYGISLEAPLTGSLVAGAVSVTGDRSIAVRELGGVTGNVILNGSITASGQNTQAVSLTGDIGGQLRLYGGVQASGFSLVTRPTNGVALQKVQATAADLQLSGPAFTIGANVAGGVYFGAAPAGTVSGSTDDANGDGVADGSETTSSVLSYSSAPALLVGSASRSITLGPFGSANFSNNYGLIIRGSVLGSGVYDGVAANGVQIGGLGGAVNIAGGVRIVGSVSASADQADATALHIGAGAIVPEVRVEGTVAAASVSSLASTAAAILIDPGASVSTITNSGTISAGMTGNKGSSVVIADKSGKVGVVLTSGIISAGLTPTATGDALAGQTTALDLSANTSGTVITQFNNGSGNVPGIYGSVLMGSGPNTVNLLAGSMIGALSLGSNAASITVDNGAIFRGAISYGGNALSLAIPNGVFENDSPTVFKAKSLTVGSTSTLVIAADPKNNRATQYLVSGPATLASGAKIGVSVQSVLTTPQSYTIISSPSLSVGATDTSLLTQTPYLFAAGLTTNQAAGTVTLSLRRRTVSELGLNTNQATAFEAVYASLANDAEVQSGVLNQTTQSGLVGAYNQLLPDHSGGQFRAGELASEAVSRATAEPDHFQQSGGGGGPWLQEVVFGVTRSNGQIDSYHGYGFGFAGGWEVDTGGFGAVGLSTAFTTYTINNQAATGANQIANTGIEGGLYWRGEIGGLRLDARAAGGAVQLRGGRELLVTTVTDGVSGILNRKNKANWHGYTLSGRVGAGYEMNFGRLFLRPQVHADYFRLNESAYGERFGGTGFDLLYAGRTGKAVSGTASLVTGMMFGSAMGLSWRPQLELGWRKAISGGPAATTANFAGGSAFTLTADDGRKGGAMARMSLKADSNYFELMLDGGGELQGKTKSGDLRFSARLLF